MSSFRDSVNMDPFKSDADKYIDAAIKECENAESEIKERLDGRTPFNIYGAIAGIIIWMIVYAAADLYLSSLIFPLVAIALLISTCLLIIARIVESIENVRYYGTIASCDSSLIRLTAALKNSKKSIDLNLQKFADSKEKDFDLSLRTVSSAYGRADSIRARVAKMEKFKDGFIKNTELVLFYLVAAAMTVSGSLALFEYCGDLVNRALRGFLPAKAINIAFIIIMAIAFVTEIILARLVWGATNCAVTNVTLLITLAGPVLFALLIPICIILIGTLGIVVALVAVGSVITVLIIIVSQIVSQWYDFSDFFDILDTVIKVLLFVLGAVIVICIIIGVLT